MAALLEYNWGAELVLWQRKTPQSLQPCLAELSAGSAQVHCAIHDAQRAWANDRKPCKKHEQHRIAALLRSESPERVSVCQCAVCA